MLAELLLRGAQTKGELRGRASRMAAIDTLDDLEEVLRPLAERRLVVYLGPPDRRGALLTHGFHAADELDGLSARQANAPAEGDVVPRAGGGHDRSADLDRRMGEAEAEIAALRAAVTDLRSQFAELVKRVGS